MTNLANQPTNPIATWRQRVGRNWCPNIHLHTDQKAGWWRFIADRDIEVEVNGKTYTMKTGQRIDLKLDPRTARVVWEEQ